MREFLFPEGCAWVLVRHSSEGEAQLSLIKTNTGQALPVFSDEDLAQTYIEAGQDMSGYTPTAVKGPERMITFLTAQQKRGVVFVALDPDHGRESAIMTKIEKAIENVRKQLPPGQQ